MLSEPLLQPLPTILGCFRVIAWAVIRMKTMLGLIIDTDLRGGSTRLQGLVHPIHAFQGNPSVFSCIESQDRPIQLVYKINRILRLQLTWFSFQLTIPRHTRPNQGIVRRVQPSDSATPAEASNTHLSGVSVVQSSPCCCCIKITHHLGIRYL